MTSKWKNVSIAYDFLRFTDSASPLVKVPYRKSISENTLSKVHFRKSLSESPLGVINYSKSSSVNGFDH